MRIEIDRYLESTMVFGLRICSGGSGVSTHGRQAPLGSYLLWCTVCLSTAPGNSGAQVKSLWPVGANERHSALPDTSFAAVAVLIKSCAYCMVAASPTVGTHHPQTVHNLPIRHSVRYSTYGLPLLSSGGFPIPFLCHLKSSKTVTSYHNAYKRGSF